jgi:TM2 domain-containing membrane protein YozV
MERGRDSGLPERMKRGRDSGSPLLSGFGAHHFYLGNIGAGIAYILLWWGGWFLSWLGIGLLLLLGVFIWWIVDLCTLRGQVDAVNRRILGAPAY